MAVATKNAGILDLRAAPLGAVGKAQHLDALTGKEAGDRDGLAGFGNPDEEVVADPVERHIGCVQIGGDQLVAVGRCFPVVLDPEIAVMFGVDVDIAARAAADDVSAAASNEDVAGGGAIDAFGKDAADMSRSVDYVRGNHADSLISYGGKLGQENICVGCSIAVKRDADHTVQGNESFRQIFGASTSF